MSTSATYNVHAMLLHVVVALMLARYLTLACDLDAARESSRQTMPGGWRGVAVDDDSVVELKESVANDAIVVDAHHVIESYQQVHHVTTVESKGMGGGFELRTCRQGHLVRPSNPRFWVMRASAST